MGFILLDMPFYQPIRPTSNFRGYINSVECMINQKPAVRGDIHVISPHWYISDVCQVMIMYCQLAFT